MQRYTVTLLSVGVMFGLRSTFIKSKLGAFTPKMQKWPPDPADVAKSGTHLSGICFGLMS